MGADGVEGLIREGLGELGLEGEELAGELERLAELLDAWAQRISLTGHRGVEAIVRRLVLDALALERQLPAAERLADLGAGAGFPGLPIALVRRGCRVLLVESREKRHHFQRAAVRALGLANAAPLRGRAEDLEPEPCDVAVAQAMGAPDQVARWLLPWVAPGGVLAIPGGASPPPVGAVAGLEPPRVVSYRVPLGGPARTLWTARRAR